MVKKSGAANQSAAGYSSQNTNRKTKKGHGGVSMDAGIHRKQTQQGATVLFTVAVATTRFPWLAATVVSKIFSHGWSHG